MKLTTKGVYGLEAMMVLALETNRCFSIQAIAASRSISIKYLEQIFQSLKKADLIVSERGKLGGYRLALPAEQITIQMILTALDEQMADTLPSNTKLHQIYTQLQMELDTVFNRITLGTLSQQYREHEFDDFVI